MVADASYSSIWISNYLTARAVGQRFLTPRGMAGLGWGLPFANGAQFAEPDRPVLCVTGDGASDIAEPSSRPLCATSCP
jgi:acetolactate synthase-1/2/3 large subunit